MQNGAVPGVVVDISNWSAATARIIQHERTKFVESLFSRGNKCHLMAKSFLREKTEPTVFGIWPVGYSDMNPRGLDHL